MSQPRPEKCSDAREVNYGSNREKCDKGHVPKASNLPPELISKIWSYVPQESQTPLLVCNLALVCRSFYEYFTSTHIWQSLDFILPKGIEGFGLYTNSVRNNVWESDGLNDWYDANCNKLIELPSEIWNHRKLLELVVTELIVWCAPSKLDFAPYASELLMASLFIDTMPQSDCFACFSEIPRSNRQLVLRAVERLPKAIRYCTPMLLNDRDFIKEVVSANGDCLQYLGDYRCDTELVMVASRTNQEVLRHARGEAQRDLKRAMDFLFENSAKHKVKSHKRDPGSSTR